MKPATTYKNGFNMPYKMFFYIVFAVLIASQCCLQVNAQDRSETLITNKYYICSDKGWDSLMSENVEKIMVILESESVLSNIEGEDVLVYLMKSANIEKIETGVKLKPYLMIYKSDTNSPDFLQDVKEEALDIEEWMYNLLHWDLKDTIIETTAPRDRGQRP